MKTQVTINGALTDVEVPDEAVIAAGFQPTARFEAELTRRAQSIVKKEGYKKPEELLADADFLGKLIEDEAFTTKVKDKLGIKSTADAAGEAATQIAEAVKRHRTDWADKELTPLQAKLKTMEAEQETLLINGLHREIVQAAAAAGVKKAFLRAATKGAPSPIVSMLEDTFAYDTDTGKFYVMSGDGEGFAFSDKGDKNQPYQTVDEFFEKFAMDKDNAEYFELNIQRGPGLQGAGSGVRPTGGAVHLSRADSRNLRLLMAAREEAKKRGLDPYADGVIVIDG